MKSAKPLGFMVFLLLGGFFLVDIAEAAPLDRAGFLEFFDFRKPKERYKEEVPAVVYFHREDCHFCQEFNPNWKEVSVHYGGEVQFYMVDVVQEIQLTQEAKVERTPTLFFFSKHYKTPKRIVGVPESQEFLQALQELRLEKKQSWWQSIKVFFKQKVAS